MNDIASLQKSYESYGDSWKERGGVGAFMMLARKWDRIEKQCRDELGYDIIGLALGQMRRGQYDGVLDDIGDLRRYLLLLGAEIRLRNADLDSLIASPEFNPVAKPDEEDMRSLSERLADAQNCDDDCGEPGPDYVDQG